jgi:phospholipase/carboxylesterase
VQTAIDTELVAFHGWTLRVRPSRVENPRLLVLIHGWTGDENSMWVFTRGFPADYWIAAPRAPHPGEPKGYSWRPLQPATLRQVQGGDWGKPSLEQLLPSARALIQLIDEYAASVGVEASTFDVIGFSQGAAMVVVLGMLFPNRIRKMSVLAGFVPSGADEYIAKRALAGRSVFVAHGTQDEMVKIDRARDSIRLLEQAGARVTYCEDEVGHKLSANCLRALERYLRD